MLYLALAIASSLAIGMIFKHAGLRGMDAVALLAVNYGVALVPGIVAASQQPVDVAALTPGFWALAVATGVLFIFGFWIYAKATEQAGLSLAIGVMRISVVIPFVASWLIWSETPSTAQLIGMGVAGFAFFLIAHKRSSDGEQAQTEASGTRWAQVALLAVLFVSGGLVDVALKTFDEVYVATVGRPVFLLVLFSVSFLLGMVYVIRQGVRGRWPTRAELAWGVLLGLINYASVEFLLLAVQVLSGPFVFPANSIALVIGGALLGVWIWGEHLSTRNKAGLGLAAVALLLLNL
ncbi:MAG: EamA family transporter [Bacteroidota bacterium]